jgi:hypothetical protein
VGKGRIATKQMHVDAIDDLRGMETWDPLGLRRPGAPAARIQFDSVSFVFFVFHTCSMFFNCPL